MITFFGEMQWWPCRQNFLLHNTRYGSKEAISGIIQNSGAIRKLCILGYLAKRH